MFVRGITLSMAALLAAGMLGTAAEAGHRRLPPPPPPDEEYYPGPPVIRYIPGLRYFFGDYGLTEEEYDRLYGDGERNFDESYYEPEPIPPKRKPLKKPPPPPSPKPVAGQDSGQSTAAPPAAAKQQPQKTAAASPKPATTGMSCEKAGSVITGYGFTSVTPASCSGNLYAFNAKRDGKSFAIKLNPANGELTDVKKLP